MDVRTLLVAEDDPQTLEIIVSGLVKAGFQVATALDGKDALEKIQRYLPDLVLYKVDLASLDGFQFLAQLKKNLNSAGPARAPVPVILLASQDHKEESVRAFEMGATDFIVKPIQLRELVARLQMVLRRLDRHRMESRLIRESLSGRLEEISVAELIEAMGIKRATGILNLVNENNRTGQIFFKDGLVVNAILGNFRGERAVYQILAWQRGTFRMVFQDVDIADEITVSNMGLLIEGMKRLETRQKLLAQLPSPNAVFTIRSNFLKIMEKKKVTSDVAKFVELFDGRRTVSQIIDESYYDDLTTLERIVKLYKQEFLEEIHSEPELQRAETIPLKPLFTREEFEAFSNRVIRNPGKERGAILVFGTLDSGKSDLIRTLAPESYRIYTPRENFPYAIDFGQIKLDENFELTLYGVPVERKFSAFLEKLQMEILGYVLLINARESNRFDYLGYLIRSLKNYFRLPYVLAITQFQGPQTWGLENIAQKLGLGATEILIPCNPRDENNAKALLLNMGFSEEEKGRDVLGEVPVQQLSE